MLPKNQKQLSIQLSHHMGTFNLFSPIKSFDIIFFIFPILVFIKLIYYNIYSKSKDELSKFNPFE